MDEASRENRIRDGRRGGSKCHVTQKEKIIIKRGKEQKTGEKRKEWRIMNFSGVWVRFLLVSRVIAYVCVHMKQADKAVSYK